MQPGLFVYTLNNGKIEIFNYLVQTRSLGHTVSVVTYIMPDKKSLQLVEIREKDICCSFSP